MDNVVPAVPAEMPIAADDTSVSLSPRLSQLGAMLLIETLRAFESGELHADPELLFK